jgi:hypothetical protein
MNRAISILSFVLSFILIAIPSIAQPPETLWMRTFGGTESDHAVDVQQTSDGGFILLACTHSFGAGSGDFWLFKTDTDGNEIWSTTFGGPYSEGANSVRQTTDGGYILCGNTESYGEGGRDIWLIKTDAIGNELWSRTFGGIYGELTGTVQQTEDGGYIISGTTPANGDNGSDIWLIKTDSVGNELWSSTYGGAESDHGGYVQQTTDGGYIAGGYTTSFGEGYRDYYLLKTDDEGNLQWFQTYGGPYDDFGRMVIQTHDGGYVIGGSTDPIGGNFHMLIIRTDTEGNQIWARTYGEEERSVFGGIQQTADGGFIITGFTDGPDGQDIWLFKTDGSGNLMWEQVFGGESQDSGEAVQQTSDNGYVVTGWTRNEGMQTDVVLYRFDPEEMLIVSIALAPVNAPILIPAEGGALQYTAVVQNLTDFPQVFAAWTEVDLPNGSTYGPVLQRHGLNLTPGGQFYATLTQEIPRIAPTGVYVYRGAIGYYPYSVFDSSEFEFEKLPPAGQTSVNNWNTVLSR